MGKIKQLFLLCLVLLLSSCTNGITNKDAEVAALASVSSEEGEWYVSSTISGNRSWIMTLKLLKDDCNEKKLYISKKDGTIKDERSGNSCYIKRN